MSALKRSSKVLALIRAVAVMPVDPRLFPYLRLIVECDTKERLGKWVALLENAVKAE